MYLRRMSGVISVSIFYLYLLYTPTPHYYLVNINYSTTLSMIHDPYVKSMAHFYLQSQLTTSQQYHVKSETRNHNIS